MIGAGPAMEFRVLAEHGEGVREIARETGASRNTVRRHLRNEEAVRHVGRAPLRTKLDSHQGRVPERLLAAAHDATPATVLPERGYPGGYKAVRHRVASPRATRPADPVVRLVSGPRPADAGRLGGDPAQRRYAVGVRGHPGVEPRRLCRVHPRRAAQDADRLPRAGVRGPGRRAARGAPRQPGEPSHAPFASRPAQDGVAVDARAAVAREGSLGDFLEAVLRAEIEARRCACARWPPARRASPPSRRWRVSTSASPPGRPRSRSESPPASPRGARREHRAARAVGRGPRPASRPPRTIWRSLGA